MVSVNAQSMITLTRILNVLDYVSLTTPDLICVTETWLEETVEDSTLFSGGSFVVICRPDFYQGQHGGQLIVTSYTLFKVATFTDVTILDFDFATGCLVHLDSFILFVVLI